MLRRLETTDAPVSVATGQSPLSVPCEYKRSGSLQEAKRECVRLTCASISLLHETCVSHLEQAEVELAPSEVCVRPVRGGRTGSHAGEHRQRCFKLAFGQQQRGGEALCCILDSGPAPAQRVLQPDAAMACAHA